MGRRGRRRRSNTDVDGCGMTPPRSRSNFSLLWTHGVGRALDEGLDLHHVVVLQLAGEVRHATILERTIEDDVLEVCDLLFRHKAEVADVAAIVDAGHAVAGGA